MQKNISKTINPAFSFLSKNATTSLRNASFVSEYFKEKDISVVSLLIGIVLNEECLATRSLVEMGVDRGEILKILFNGKIVEIVGDTNAPRDISLSEEVKEVLRKSFDFSQKMSHVYVGTEHLLVSILLVENPKIKKLKKLGLTYESFRKVLSRYATYPIGLIAKPNKMGYEEDSAGIIDMLGIDLVELAKGGKLDPVIGREKEIAQLINILSRRKKNNPIVVGEAGVGKSVLIEGLAQKIAQGYVPSSLKDFRIISLDVASIMAGSKMRGDVEEKVMAIVDEVISSKNTILFIDEIHNIVAPGMPGSSSDIAAVLKPALLQEGFRCIGATTVDEYTMYFEADNALVRRFQPIFLQEASVDVSLEILQNMKGILEKHHNVKISDESLKYAVLLSDRYVNDRYLPDKAIDILDEAAASKRLYVEYEFKDLSKLQLDLDKIRKKKEKKISLGKMEEAISLQKSEKNLIKKIQEREKECIKSKKSTSNQVTSEDVRNVISKWTGIPLNTLGNKEKKSLLNLETSLNSNVIGQKEACSLVASAIKRARTGIIDKDRPWASFLFLGPTGVGKTELAKILTRELFGDENHLIQIDMSEMMEMHSVSKLIGSPPGYVGYQQGGWLTEKIRRQPHSVILFDEIEKAHPDVLNVLLQILEYGHLMDGKGRRVNFKNTVVVLTSNIGAEEIMKDKILGFGEKKQEKRKDVDIDRAYDSMKTLLLGELRDSLRPELLNRLDDVVIFRSLTRKDAKKIVKLLLENLNERLKEERIHVVLDERAIEYVVREGFSEEYGARPLRRLLQDKVENLLADYILENRDLVEKIKIVEIRIGLKDNRLVIL
ncbi:MAG: ATP-dependent Clp protease ATP-binding subunit [Candidatus Dojkabacteria bacterium]